MIFILEAKPADHIVSAIFISAQLRDCNDLIYLSQHQVSSNIRHIYSMTQAQNKAQSYRSRPEQKGDLGRILHISTEV
jgi:hypothetical protein